jgi:hypothetical protein
MIWLFQGIVDPNLALALESEPKKEADFTEDLRSVGTVEDGNMKGTVFKICWNK